MDARIVEGIGQMGKGRRWYDIGIWFDTFAHVEFKGLDVLVCIALANEHTIYKGLIIQSNGRMCSFIFCRKGLLAVE